MRIVRVVFRKLFAVRFTVRYANFPLRLLLCIPQKSCRVFAVFFAFFIVFHYKRIFKLFNFFLKKH